MLHKIIAAVSAIALATSASAVQFLQTNSSDQAIAENQWDTGRVGQALDLTGFGRVGPTATNDAATCDIAPLNRNTAGQGAHTWYPEENQGNSPIANQVPNVAPTPATITLANSAGTYKGVNPYSCSNGVLSITLNNPTGSQWQAGAIDSASPYRDGYTFRYGYFEVQLLLPALPTGLCPWASQWFTQQGQGAARPSWLEFDQFETCDVSPGYNDPTTITSTLHWWPRPNAPLYTAARWLHATKVNTTALNLFDGLWHTYGTMFTPRWIIYYRDGLEVARYPMLARDMTGQNMVVIDISHASAITAATTASWTMQVRNARWYACTRGPTSCER